MEKESEGGMEHTEQAFAVEVRVSGESNENEMLQSLGDDGLVEDDSMEMSASNAPTKIAPPSTRRSNRAGTRGRKKG